MLLAMTVDSTGFRLTHLQYSDKQTGHSERSEAILPVHLQSLNSRVIASEAKQSYGLGSNKIRKGVPFWNALLIKVGDDLLSHNCSTIGAIGLNFSVRNGKRWNPDAIVT